MVALIKEFDATDQPRYYDRSGKPIDMHQWAKWGEDVAYKRIRETTIGDYWISTVWLGLNHNFGSGPPLIFETMVFYRGESDSDIMDGGEWMDRYSTEAQAVKGHERMVEEVRKHLP